MVSVDPLIYLMKCYRLSLHTIVKCIGTFPKLPSFLVAVMVVLGSADGERGCSVNQDVNYFVHVLYTNIFY